MAGTADLKHLDDRFGQIISSQSESHSMMRTLLTCAGIPFFPSATTTVSPRIGAFPLSFCILARSLFSRRVNFNDYISLDARARARVIREMFRSPGGGEVSRGRANLLFRGFDPLVR